MCYVSIKCCWWDLIEEIVFRVTVNQHEYVFLSFSTILLFQEISTHLMITPKIWITIELIPLKETFQLENWKKKCLNFCVEWTFFTWSIMFKVCEIHWYSKEINHTSVFIGCPWTTRMVFRDNRNRFHWQRLSYIITWISNRLHFSKWDVIIHSFSNMVLLAK